MSGQLLKQSKDGKGVEKWIKTHAHLGAETPSDLVAGASTSRLSPAPQTTPAENVPTSEGMMPVAHPYTGFHNQRGMRIKTVF